MKKQKRELLNNTFNSFIEVGLSGENLEIIEDIVSKDVVGFGTTVDEKLFGVKELRDLLIRQKEQSAGMELSWKINTLDLYISSDENTAIFTNEITLNLIVDDNPIEIYLRFSIVMEYADDKWMVVHWHGSKPEQVESEKDTWGVQTWKEKAEELENLVAERTADLVVKNRELEIETALERIRAQAVAMRESSDLLDIVVTMRNEFIKLGHEAHYFWHMMWLPETYEKAMTSGDGTKIGFVMQLPRHIHGNIPQLAKWEKSKKPTVVYTMTVDEAIDYVDKMVSLGDFKNIDPQAPSHDDIRHIGGLTFIMSRTTHGEIGYSLPGVVENPPKADIDILVKFASAFDLAHQRFLDLQKAETQARETQIELALEKIRSRSMAMHKSDELKEIILVVYEQLVQLQVKVEHAGFIVDYKENDDMHIWLADRNAVFPKIVLPYFDCAHWNDFIEAKKTGQNFFTNQLGFEEKNKFYKDVFQFIPNLPDDTKATYFEFEGLAISTVLLDNVGLYIENYMGIPFTEVENAILMRFGKVFQQAYTRFLDLKKAEAQAQEAQIEAALEKVRSRSLAMHKSDELKEVVAVVLQKLQELNIAMDSRVAVIVIFKEGSTDFNQWVASPTDISNSYISTPYFEHIILSDFWKAREIGLDFYSKSYSKDEKNTYFEHFFDHSFFKNFEGIEEQKKWALEKEFYTYSPVFETNSSLGIADFSGEPLSEKEISILKRFAKVFEQAYIRFLDLQKAEAQAREAQIQLALERVRAKTMAMKTQSDLLGIVELFGQQLSDLDVRFTDVTFIEGAITKNRDWELWSHVPNADNFTHKIHIPYIDTPYFTKTAKAVEEYERTGNPIQTKFFSKEEKDEFLDHYWKYAPAVLEKAMELVYANPGSTIVDAFLENVTVSLVRSDLEPFTEEELSIFERFSKEFKQTYTRYLDIKKAEAQARESEIQLALERVRARTMAMQKSEELAEASQVLDQQVRALGIETWGCAFHIYADNDEGDFEWFSGANGLLPFYKTPRKEFFLKFYEKGQQGEKFHIEEFIGEDCKTHYNFLKTIPVAGDALKALEESGVPLPTYQIDHIAFFNHGYVLFITYQPVPEAHDIFQRFAKVFEQTYTRFLDLQKAEAQAKEAQLESALERVRSRSLAMHHSSELSNVVDTLLQEFTNLEFTLTFCIINLIDEQDMSNTVWAANPETGKDPESYYMKFEDYPFHHAMWDAWKAQKKRFVYTIEGEEKKLYDEYLYTDTEFRRFPKNVQEANKTLERYVAGFTFFKYSGLQTVSVNPISEDELETLERFGRVFEQAYTRFLDLKKAEAQAREAQIEAALEKVRSRSMAMHNSQELKEVALELRKQMGLLGQKDLEVCAIHLYGNDEDSFESWSAMKASDSETEIVQTQAHFPKRGIRIVDEMMHHYNIGTKDYVLINEGEKIAEWFKVLKKHAPELHTSILDSIGKVPEKQLKANWAVADFSGGALVMVTYGEPDEVSRNLLRRSANVFEQAYVRFLDLKKAEEQARESQIEASLERVRSKALAMHNTDDLRQTITVIFDELKGLNIKTIRLGLGLVNPDFPEGEIVTSRIDEKDQILEVSGKFRLEGHPILDSIYDHFKQQQDHFPILEGEEINSYYNALQGSVNVQGQGTDTKHFGCFLYFKEGCLYAWSAEPHSEEQIDILKKFSRVVEITYRRYIELQKAEEQAKEAQIEASLERIRAKAMAMHQSDELDEVLAVLCEQFDTLGIFPMSTHMTVLDIANNKFTFRETGKFGNRSFGEQTVALDAMDTWKDMVESWKSAEPYSINRLHFPKETLPQVWEIFHESFASMPEGSKITPDDYPDGIYHTAGKHPFGYIGMNQVRPATEKEEQIVVKFANEFGRAYQRFLDLQKAEAQAREAQIVASMERVRAATMAMHQSNELSLVLSKLFEQFDVLGIKPSHAVLTLIDKEKNTLNFRTTGKNGYQVLAEQEVDLNVMNAWVDTAEKWKKSNPNTVNVNEFPPEILPEVWEVYKDILASIPKKARPEIKDFPDGLFITEGYCRFGYIGFAHHRKPTEEEKDIVRRIAAEFGTLYQRFLDLKKSEAQAREAQIETALEKVRSRTMAMQKGDELQEVAVLLYKELIALGVTNFVTCGYVEVNEAIQRQHTWVTSPGGDTMGLFHLPLTGDATFDARYAAWKKQQTVFHQSVAGQIRRDHLEYAITTFNSKEAEEMVRSQFPDPTVFYCFNFSHGYLHLVGGSLLEKEEEVLLARFTKVFEQTYTRFLDLQKAEAQAKEAKIEVALEKVRSRTMGMQKSDELADVANVLFQEMNNLVHNLWTCGFVLCEKDRQEDEWWLSLEDGFSRGFFLPNVNDYAHSHLYEGWLKKDDFRTVQLEGDDLQAHYDWLMKIPIAKSIFDEMEAAGMQRPEWQKLHAAYFSKGYLVIITREPCGEEAIFKRFAQVFDLTYTRFLDLQKAEAQVREAQIEAALERVRSRSMAMHKSEELLEVISVVSEQLQQLDFKFIHVSFANNDSGQDYKFWTAFKGIYKPMRFSVPYSDITMFNNLRKAQETSVSFFTDILSQKENMEWHKQFLNHGGSDVFSKEENEFIMSRGMARSIAINPNIILILANYASIPYSEADNKIIERFALVFEQSYTRFLDLEKAERQAREAQIENALEKVRSRSLAMQSPNELIEVAQLLREEMGALGVEELETSSIYIQEENTETTQCWFTIKDSDHPDNSVTDQMTINLKETWVGRAMEAFYRSSEKQTSIVMKGDHRKEWMEYCERHSNLFSTTKFYGDTIPERTYHLYKFSDGFIGAASPGDISVESWDLLRRATAVFSFAYTRFRDLQVAETSARAALRQASLDRVRADISSMRNAKDLERITPLVFNELTTLGIPFIRCGVFIVHEKTKNVEVYLSSPEGKSLAVMNLPFGANDMTIQSVKAWKNKKVFIQHWDKSDFVNWSKSLQEQGHVKDLNTYQGDKAAPESLHLHFIPFNQGLLYVGADQTLNSEQIDLVKALSESFAIAYARYEDFVKLEKAKAEVEIAMNELKATQSQLIQSEKMASLGELTAGIAHEIQNPLNFVNNFSEVSVEMMQEVREEIATVMANRDKPIPDGALDEISTILDDIESNLGKINHHGKRADAIVKGMLAHSRSSSGEKVPTDINALAEEYLRLSYHGLRAKDKSFNADFSTNFDPDLPKVNVVPQDIGRVLLNLINNAFQACAERSRSTASTEALAKEDPNFKPLVTVTTKQTDNFIQITVSDNGPGIPEAIKDKIFQPFFTTKPTGQGTGLGLSLSYDIVKAHGGEIKVETKEGKGLPARQAGTTFIILLTTKH